MTDNVQDIEFLRERAASLPLRPGVYIMKDKNGKIIYVGKSRVLRQRVSQYFQDNAHDRKTTKMVSCVRDFEWMLTDSEIEALSLENKLIKLHKPKFNIKLKDDRNYPYIKISINEEYPQMTVVRKRQNDGARYFGPYSGSGIAYTILRTLQKTFGIASCKKEFPKDIGKSRPCLYKQLGQCVGPCTGDISSSDYKECFKEAMLLLRGDINEIKKDLTDKMEFASENLMFEAAAVYRDRIVAIENLWQRQKVVSSPNTEQDVVAYFENDICSCITILYIRGGSLIDKESFIFDADMLMSAEDIIAFMSDLYLKREYIPKEILLDFQVEDAELELFSEYLHNQAGYRVHVHVPERGDKRQLCEMAYDNAKQYVEQHLRESEKQDDTLIRLARLLKLEVIPERIEAYDISNLGAERIVAGMITIVDTKFDKSSYRSFNIKPHGKPDDYAAMREAIERRFNHPELEFPDLILLDGGKGHVSKIQSLMDTMGIYIPVFGMVKDDYHKTRALTTDDHEISIAKEQAVFAFIYRIQEEVHRFTVKKMSTAKEKTMRTSSLEEISGIGKAKAAALLKHFGTLTKLKSATHDELVEVRGVSNRDADEIIKYFKENNKTTKGKQTK